MCNEVCEEAGRFREVLGGLMRDGKCEFEFIFILDGLYENCALIVPHFVKVRRLGTNLLTCCWSLVHGSSVIKGRPISPRLGIDENKRDRKSVV